MKVPQEEGCATGWDRCVDLARRWLTACGQSGCYYAIQELRRFSDEELADKCISCWCLDEPQGDDNDITWFEQHEADRRMLIEAFTTVRSFFSDAV
jgi:hypothetical protein